MLQYEVNLALDMTVCWSCARVNNQQDDNQFDLITSHTFHLLTQQHFFLPCNTKGQPTYGQRLQFQSVPSTKLSYNFMDYFNDAFMVNFCHFLGGIFWGFWPSSHCMEKNSLDTLFLLCCTEKDKKKVCVFSNKRVSGWWKKLHFWVHYSFKIRARLIAQQEISCGSQRCLAITGWKMKTQACGGWSESLFESSIWSTKSFILLSEANLVQQVLHFQVTQPSLYDIRETLCLRPARINRGHYG